MKRLILAILLLSNAASAALHTVKQPSLEALATYSFDDFTKDFNKNYASAEERASREATFNENLNMIRAHNANPAKSWTMNVNHMADWTVSERNGIMGHIPSYRRGLTPFLKNLQTVSESSREDAGDLPDSLDWREKEVVTPVKDQGACGSCWAFSATESMESHWALKTGKLLELSTQQVTSCTPNPDECGGTGGCEGATEVLAYEYAVKDGGLVEEKAWPYGGHDEECKIPKDAKRVATFSGYVVVETNDQEKVIEALADKGPLSIGVWADPMAFYFGGIFSGCDYSQNMNINHAVQLVGYGSEDGTDYWIVRNSWGSWWGEGGYIRLLRESEAKCGMDTTPKDGSACKKDPDTPVKVCGQCGLLAEASYPVAKDEGTKAKH